jgi:glycogen operon protein
MSDEDWQAGLAKSLGVFLNGRGIPTPNERGEQVVDESFYVMFNADHAPLDFTLPEPKWGERWIEVLDTSAAEDFLDEDKLGPEYPARAIVNVPPWSLRLLRRVA